MCTIYYSEGEKEKKKVQGPLTRKKGEKKRVHCQCHSQLTSVQALGKRTDVQRVTI